MSANCNKVNREKMVIRKISALVKIFFRSIYDTFRDILTGPGLFCEGCLFSSGRVPPTPVFLFNPGGLRSCGTKVIGPGPIIISLDRIVLRWRPTRAVQRGYRQGRGISARPPVFALYKSWYRQWLDLQKGCLVEPREPSPERNLSHCRFS